MIQINESNSPSSTKIVVNSLEEKPFNENPSHSSYISYQNDDMINNIDCSEHHDRHKNCNLPVHKNFLLYSIIQFLELIFINKRANQTGIIPKELKPSQCLTSNNVDILTSPISLRSFCKFTECQISEITYRIKLFDEFRSELTKYRSMIDNASKYDTEILNLQCKKVDQFFKIAFDGYNWWDKKKSNNSKRINQYDIIICDIKLKNILKARKRMETMKKKREKLSQNIRFRPYVKR